MDSINIFWFRRDLRLHDNTALYHALSEDLPVLPIFIFDTEIIDHLNEKSDKRLSFIKLKLLEIKENLEKDGNSLLVLKGKPIEIFELLLKTYSIKKVFTNLDYEPYAINRDQSICKLLSLNGIEFITFKDQVVFEKTEISKSDGKPYTVFTPYSKKWKETYNLSPIQRFPSETLLFKLIKTPPFEFPLTNISYIPNSYFTDIHPDISIISSYSLNRNYPALQGTSKLGIHLRFGTLSIREMVQLAYNQNETWLDELIWREFFMQILYNFPLVATNSFKSKYDRIEWINNEEEFQKWCEGKTGYPIVDAGMRELNETGFMHNRVRMITASFLTKHLLIDWRWGEAYFASKLLDFELSSNNGNWQWAAGCGCDAAPYFRIFNPFIQAKKFDPKNEYILKWIPEFNTSKYPKPIVNHAFARERCLEVYKLAIID